MKRKEGSVAKNAAARVAMYALNLLVPVLVGPYVARVLDVSAYGAYNAALSVMQWFLSLASFGVYAYGVRQASRARDDAEKTRAVFEPLFRFGVLAALLSWLLFTALSLFQGEQRALYLALGLQVLSNAVAVEWVNEAFEDYPFLLYKTAAVRLLYTAAVFLFVRRAGDALAFALISSFAAVIDHALGFFFVRRRVKRKKLRLFELKPLIKPLSLAFLLANANLLYLMLDKLYLSAFSPDKALVTYYALPMLILSAVMNVLSSLLYVAVPRLSHRISQGDEAGYRELLASSSHMFFLLAMPACALVGALGPQMMLLYGGGRYAAAGGALMVFGVRFVLNACDLSLANQVLYPHGMERPLLKIYLMFGALNLACKGALFLFRSFDPALLVATTALCEGAAVIFEHRLIRRKFGKGFSPLDQSALLYAAASLCFYPVCALLRRAFPLRFTLDTAFFLYLLAACTSCGALYLAALLLGRDPHFMGLVRRLKARLKRA